MKKAYLLFFTSLLLANLDAQITLKSEANAPKVGDSFDYLATVDPLFDVTHSGMDQVWDFSGASKDAPATINYIPIDNSSEPANYPLANVVEFSPTGENYYAISDTEYTLQGQLIPNQIRIIYTDKREFLKFPITYGDVFNETFTGTIENIASNQTLIRGGSIEIMADGYGDLILPYTKVYNVLRVRAVYSYRDSFMNDALFHYADTIYSWYNAETNNALAYYGVSYFNGDQASSQALHMDETDLINAIGDLPTIDRPLSIFPNPASEYFQINDLAEETINSVRIHDATGKLLRIVGINDKQQKIDIADLCTGIYFIQYTTKSNAYIDKLVVD